MAQALRAAEDHLKAANHIARGVANHGPVPGGAEAALARVRELHQPYIAPADADTALCRTCDLTHPCPTIRAIEGSTDE